MNTIERATTPWWQAQRNVVDNGGVAGAITTGTINDLFRRYYIEPMRQYINRPNALAEMLMDQARGMTSWDTETVSRPSYPQVDEGQ